MAIYGINYINESTILNESIFDPKITLDEVKIARDVFEKYVNRYKDCAKYVRVFSDYNLQERFKEGKNKSMIGAYTSGVENNISMLIRDIIDDSNSKLIDKKIKIVQEDMTKAKMSTIKTFSKEGGIPIYAKKIK